MYKKTKYIQYLLIITIVIFVIVSYVLYVSRKPDRLEVYFFDTKGTPSIFIRTTDDRRILIDGGSNSGIIRNITRILPFYSRRIDMIIVTNINGEKVVGLTDVINRYEVGSLLMSSSTDQSSVVLEELANKRGILVQNRQKEIYMPNSDKDVPSLRLVQLAGSAWNISYGNNSILLLGDAGLKVQKSQINTNCSTDVLFIPHSISANSLSIDLMNKVCPKYIIYSQTITKQQVKSTKTDPLYMIMKDHRYNLKEKSTIEVLSDGSTIDIR